MYLINFLSDKPNKKYLPRINTVCFLCLVANFFLMFACGHEEAIYCVGSMVFLATLLFMGHTKQLVITLEDKQKEL